ncbi:MAG: CHASE domain-containing protein, partial [Thermodesulfovibrionales bacterium]
MHAFVIKKRLPSIVVVTTLCIGVALSILGFTVVQKWEVQKLWLDFNRAAENRHVWLGREIESDLQTLVSLQAFYLNSEKINRSEFHEFTKTLLSQHPHIHALEWIPRIPSDRREGFENAAKKEGFPNFQITERDARGKLIRAGKREEYFPVYFVEPYEANELVLGFNLASDQKLRDTLEQSRDTGEMLATERLKLTQETADRSGFLDGFLVFAPIYKKGVPTGSVQTRRKSLRGFALGVFRIGEVVEGALAYLESEDLDLYIYDESAPRERRFLYFRQSPAYMTTTLPMSDAELNSYKGIKYAKTLDVAGREWVVVLIPTRDFIASRKTWLPQGVLSVGLLLTVLLARFLWANISRSEKLSNINKQLLHEIAERKKAEDELKLFRNLIDQANDAIFVTDPETGRFLDANANACKNLGYDREELLTKTVADVDSVMAPDASSWKTHADEIKKKGHVVTESRSMRKDGTTYPIEISVKHISLEKRAYLVAVVRDITERKKAGEELRRIEKKYKDLFDTTLDGIYQIDADGVFILMNPAGARMFGHESPYEMIGRKGLEYWRDPRDREAFRAELKIKKSVNGYPMRLKKKNGEPIELETSSTLMEDEQGQFLGMEGILRDVTERKKLEDQLRQSQKMEAVGQLAGGIAHDFNNILTAIIGYGHLLYMKMDSNDPLRVNVEQILESGDRAASLTQNLLSFSSKQIMNPRPVSLNEIMM